MTKDGTVYPLQVAMMERGTRATRNVDFIEKAGKKFGEAMASLGGRAPGLVELGNEHYLDTYALMMPTAAS